MKCLKCEKDEYCSKLCKEHFIRYVYKKFKNYLGKAKIIKRGESVRLKGKNKKLAKHLLMSVPDLNASFVSNGKEFLTYSMDYKVIREVEGLMTEMKPLAVSVLECFREEELEGFCILKKMKFEPEEHSKLGFKILTEMDRMEKRKPNIYTSSYKILEKFYQAVNKKF